MGNAKDSSPLSAGDLSPSDIKGASKSVSRAAERGPALATSRQSTQSGDESPHSKAVAILFGPENGPLSERLVREAWDEAGLKHYTHLHVIGLAIDPKARQFIDSAGKIGVPCTYLHATMDLQMGDLLKNMRSSQIFSVCGLPDVTLRKIRNPKSEMKSSGRSNFSAWTPSIR